jgi:hypothetical protein
MFMMVPLFICGTAYLIPRNEPRSKKGNGSVKSFHRNISDRSAFCSRSGVVDDAIEATEPLDDKFHQLLGVGCAEASAR